MHRNRAAAVSWRLLVTVTAALGPSPAAGRELDPGACAARFEVQRDKIIRTEESRAMGARYLSELDVGSRAECRRLCCETDTCDVFVLEEQSPGSCYLFACGPPEDFRCKFTTHSNFSSGVLALSRRLAELQDLERRGPGPGPGPGPTAAATTTSAAVTTTTITTTVAPPVTTHAPRRCSRYQFECHSGGECIAVYNACDGVAQCADGSDEAPELGCPATAPVTGGAGAAPAGGAGVAARPWPSRLSQAQPGLGPGPGAGRAAAVVATGTGGPRAHRPPYGYGEEVAEGLMGGGDGGVWGGGGGWRWGAGAGGGWGVAPPPPPARSPVPQTMPELPPPPPPPPPLHDAPKKGLGLAPPPSLAPSPAPTPATTLPPTPTPTPAHMRHTEKTSVRTVHERLLSESADVEDGPAERPRAAALLLVLGLAMAAAAAALALGCGRRGGRARGRGMRAHSRADYLVNGMYL